MHKEHQTRTEKTFSLAHNNINNKDIEPRKILKAIKENYRVAYKVKLNRKIPNISLANLKAEGLEHMFYRL